MKKLITGNEAVAQGALRAGVKVVSGYPGTPSTGALTSLLVKPDPQRHVEWSTNEKVAIEIAAGAAWAGQRALCTMKMSGVNVAFDSLISVAYSGCEGALVIYVADDPGASAGMCEQDSRSYALMSDLPMFEPVSVADAYELTYQAFALSEAIKGPVFVRLVTAVANSYAEVELQPPDVIPDRDPILDHDIMRYTKAGSTVVMNQHHALIERLKLADLWLREHKVNDLQLANQTGGVGVIINGLIYAYLEEALGQLDEEQFSRDTLSILRLRASHPAPEMEIRQLLKHCSKVVVLEELEPHIERSVYVHAQQMKYQGEIIGKLDGTLSRVGEYGGAQVLRGLAAGLDITLPEKQTRLFDEVEALATDRPITTCAGCPHRGTYMAINRALKNLKLKKREVMVTGDIGCTILGMNPPFNTVWNEVSMGASVSLAQGFVHAGIKTPVIATIGDSTFFHGGMPGLLNAIQHRVNMTLIIMDNRWTAMTGMQVNPGTPLNYQMQNDHSLDLVELVQHMGIEQFAVVDPFDQPQTIEAIEDALQKDGVKVIVARQECAIQATRHQGIKGTMQVNAEKCTKCKVCLMITGCPALCFVDGVMSVDPAICYGCGLCATVCKFDALELEVQR
ncbi:MAG: 4Fe-4S binding protein [Anaerolineaceae bacterium]|nr:4Fe-4S binding protein [Anaerolineaceae bacterium]